MNSVMLQIKAPKRMPPGVHALTTTRLGGRSDAPFDSLNTASHVGDSDVAVTCNRRLLKSSLALPQEPCWLNQVHGNRIALSGDADASYTAEADVVLCIQTADCLPVLLWSDDASEVAAVHAGWKGLQNGGSRLKAGDSRIA